MSKRIQVSDAVFAAIWSMSKTNLTTEDEILKDYFRRHDPDARVIFDRWEGKTAATTCLARPIKKQKL